MKTPKVLILLFLILIGLASANLYNLNGQVMDSGAVVNGSSAGNYSIENEMGLISGNSSSTNYGGMYGLFLYLSNNTQQFNGTILLQITYPPNNSAYGPGQCWISTTVLNYINGSAAQPTGTCWLYFNNGSNWLLNQTAAIIGNATINWTGLTTSGLYGVNCTSTLGASTNTTGLTQFNIIGTSFCPGGSNNTPDATLIFFGMLVLLAIVWLSGFISDIYSAFIAIFILLGAITYAGLISLPANLPSMNQVFIFFFLIFALGLLFSILFLFISIIVSIKDQFNKRGKNY